LPEFLIKGFFLPYCLSKNGIKDFFGQGQGHV